MFLFSARADTRRSSRACRTSSSCSVTSTTPSPTISCPPPASSSPPSEPPGASTTSLPPSGYSRVRLYTCQQPPHHHLRHQEKREPRRIPQTGKNYLLTLPSARRHQRQGREQGPIHRVPGGAAERPGRAGRRAQGGPLPHQLVNHAMQCKQEFERRN
jgi:hypothetical protein